MLPGDVVIEEVDAAADFDASEAIDQLFMVGPAERGSSTEPKRSLSFEQWTRRYGGDLQYSECYQAARLFFEEMAESPHAALVFLREVGPNPVRASSTAKNNVPANVISIEAVDYGEYGNNLTRQFVAGAVSGVQLIICEGAKVLAHSGDLTTQGDIAAWGNATGVVIVNVLGGAGLPVVDGGAVALAGGTDDHTHATNANKKAAVNLLDVRMGPGMLTLPGATTEEAHEIQAEHFLKFDRVGIPELPDSGSAGTLTGNVVSARAAEGAEGLFPVAPWVQTPDGFDVPPGAFAAAKIAAQYLASGNPNEPAAGTKGRAIWVTGLTQDFSAATREALDAGGVQAIYDVDGQGDIQLHGFDTLADPETLPLHTAMSNALLDMLIRWKGRALGRDLAFSEVDPQGHLVSLWASKLEGMLKKMKGEGALWGYTVDTQSVNNATTASEKRLKARMGIERSQYAKTVYLDIEVKAIGAS